MELYLNFNTSDIDGLVFLLHRSFHWCSIRAWMRKLTSNWLPGDRLVFPIIIKNRRNKLRRWAQPVPAVRSELSTRWWRKPLLQAGLAILIDSLALSAPWIPTSELQLHVKTDNSFSLYAFWQRSRMGWKCIYTCFYFKQEDLIQCTEPDSVQVSTKDMDSTLSKASRVIKKTSKKVKWSPN